MEGIPRTPEGDKELSPDEAREKLRDLLKEVEEVEKKEKKEGE